MNPCFHPFRAPMRSRPAAIVAAVIATLLALAILIAAGPAWAVKAVPVGADQDVIDISGAAEVLGARGDSIQVDTASDQGGMSDRMSVRASAPGLSPNWLVFALRNVTDRQIERWVTAQRYTLIGSGVVWPDLDTRRIEAITPSLGFLPERVRSDRADIFKITLEPGQTVTYVAELASDRVGGIYVWKPVEYELKQRERQLYNGILLGITGVLGIFLTAVFAANHKPIFPSAALVTWCVLGYLCVDFGFWHRLFQLRPEDNAVYRAATEAAVAASMLVFLRIFLRLTAAPGLMRVLLAVWIIVQLSLVALAVIDARLAATFARVSFALIGGVGILAIAYLSLLGQDRALALLPSWILFLVWIFAAAVTLTGRMTGDAVVSSLSGGLVLITVLLGFTVTQFAFRALDVAPGAASGEQSSRGLAVDAAGAALWEWNVRRDEIKTGRIIEASLGLQAGELSCNSESFCSHLHPADRERLRLLLWSVKEHGGGDVRLEMRMLHADNSYRWFDLSAASLPAKDRRALKCVGLLRDITETKRSQERLLQDGVRDGLTGLPNRELFLDRLSVAVARARYEPMVLPGIVLIDIDKFRNVNSAYGLVVGDSLLLTLARRLQRHLGDRDTLARLGGNQFAILLMQAHDAREIAELAENVRRSVRAPIAIAGQDVVLTAALGIAVWDKEIATAEALLKDAEIAMYRAKRGGADRVETFHPDMRSESDTRVVVESELAGALDRRELTVSYQPIVSLSTGEIAGYEALVRWQHPRLGLIGPSLFVPVAEESDLIVKLGNYVLHRAVEDAAAWLKILPRAERPLFVSVNMSSRQLFRPELVQEIRQIAGRSLLPPGALRLELTESLVMENPEKAVEVLDWLRSAGAGLSLDDFGTGYSSLAYLNRFPFDTIKIDCDLVQVAPTDANGAAIVRSIVALAHELGKKVVAEGVELQEDVQFLRGIGCEFAQGYFYGEPISQREVERMLRQIRKNERRLNAKRLFAAKAAKRQVKTAAVKPSKQNSAGPAPAASPPPHPEVPATNAADVAPPPVPAAAFASPQFYPEPPAYDSSPLPAYVNGIGHPGSQQASYTPPVPPPLDAVAVANGAIDNIVDMLNGAREAAAAAQPPGFPHSPANAAVTIGSEAAVDPYGVSENPDAGYVTPQPVPPPQPSERAAPKQADLSNLPPAIAASLARLSRAKRDGGPTSGNAA